MMNGNLDIINARLIGYQALQRISIRDGVIISHMSTDHQPLAADGVELDVAGDWLSLGGVDLQINGALGLAFPDLNPDNSSQLQAIGDYLWQQGVDAYMPTIVTASTATIQQALEVLEAWAAITPSSTTATILGVHLEGPCLNPAKRGAHPAEHLQPLNIDSLRHIWGNYSDLVQIMTLAPELDPSGQVIPYLRSLDITVSLGHSLATAAQAQQAFSQGASMVTHAFNAMPSLHHRDPGLLGAAIIDPHVYCGLIADGEHVSPIMIDILLRASHYDQGIFLVSDALAPLGLPDGTYPWDTRQIDVRHGTARLADGTLAGTTLPLLRGVQNLVDWGICDVESAIALATVAPRCAIGLSTDYTGQPASRLLRWQEAPTLTWQRLLTAPAQIGLPTR